MARGHRHIYEAKISWIKKILKACTELKHLKAQHKHRGIYYLLFINSFINIDKHEG